MLNTSRGTFLTVSLKLSQCDHYNVKALQIFRGIFWNLE